MRDSNRIKYMTEVLYQLWSKPENQDLRLGQLLYNLYIANRQHTKNQADIFNTEDLEWLDWMIEDYNSL